VTIHPFHSAVKKACEDRRADFNRDLLNRVEWIEEAAHPLAGCIRSRSSFLAYTYETLGRRLPQGTKLEVENVRVTSDYAVVTLRFQPEHAEMELEHRYRWICRLDAAPN
jgi:hypothetical protein